MLRFIPWKSALSGLVAVGSCLLFGMAMQPFNQSTKALLVQEDLLQATPVSLGDDALSQQLAFFALGGLRSLAAQILGLDATVAWSRGDWETLEKRYSQMTTLCPQRENYWVAASFEMATNAASTGAFYGHDLDESDIALKRRQYFLRGEQFLKDGIRNNPESALLQIRLGDLHSNLFRYPRFLQAATAYGKAVELGATPMYERSQFYSLSRVHGKEREAWELGRKIFKNYPQDHVPSVVCLLFALENKLNIKPEERISMKDLFTTRERAERLLRGYADNTLLYPTYGVKDYLNNQFPTNWEQFPQ